MLTKVTMTGADDSIHPSDLHELQRRYPFVEWGILVASNYYGNVRFPSQYWLEHLVDVPELKLSCHLCGSYVKDFLNGDTVAIKHLQAREDIWNKFSRVQLNTHGFKHNFDPTSLIATIEMFADHEFIIQHDNKNNHILDAIRSKVSNISVLYDLSHGAGILPTQWPNLLVDVKCGYAGGLDSNNVKGQLEIIESIVGDTPIWIDAETHIRSLDNTKFDLSKVNSFLEACEPFVRI